MTAKPNPRVGSSFDSWLDEEGIRAEVEASAIAAVSAWRADNPVTPDATPAPRPPDRAR